jgi:hypothetical protein
VLLLLLLLGKERLCIIFHDLLCFGIGSQLLVLL